MAACSLRGGRVRVELEAQTYEKAIKENTLMASKYDGLARIIIQNVGGKSNINSVAHCITRIRHRCHLRLLHRNSSNRANRSVNGHSRKQIRQVSAPAK